MCYAVVVNPTTGDIHGVGIQYLILGFRIRHVNTAAVGMCSVGLDGAGRCGDLILMQINGNGTGHGNGRTTANCDTAAVISLIFGYHTAHDEHGGLLTDRNAAAFLTVGKFGAFLISRSKVFLDGTAVQLHGGLVRQDNTAAQTGGPVINDVTTVKYHAVLNLMGSIAGTGHDGDTAAVTGLVVGNNTIIDDHSGIVMHCNTAAGRGCLIVGNRTAIAFIVQTGGHGGACTDSNAATDVGFVIHDITTDHLDPGTIENRDTAAVTAGGGGSGGAVLGSGSSVEHVCLIGGSGIGDANHHFLSHRIAALIQNGVAFLVGDFHGLSGYNLISADFTAVDVTDGLVTGQVDTAAVTAGNSTCTEYQISAVIFGFAGTHTHRAGISLGKTSLVAVNFSAGNIDGTSTVAVQFAGFRKIGVGDHTSVHEDTAAVTGCTIVVHRTNVKGDILVDTLNLLLVGCTAFGGGIVGFHTEPNAAAILGRNIVINLSAAKLEGNGMTIGLGIFNCLSRIGTDRNTAANGGNVVMQGGSGVENQRGGLIVAKHTGGVVIKLEGNAAAHQGCFIIPEFTAGDGHSGFAENTAAVPAGIVAIEGTVGN